MHSSNYIISVEHSAHNAIRGCVHRALAPLELAVVTELLLLFGCGTWVMSARLLSSWTRTPLPLSIIVGRRCGQLQPTSSSSTSLVALRLIRRTLRTTSTDSVCCTAVATAIVSVRCIVMPRWRAVGESTVTLLCVAVVITSHYWVRDVTARHYWHVRRLDEVQLAAPAWLS